MYKLSKEEASKTKPMLQVKGTPRTESAHSTPTDGGGEGLGEQMSKHKRLTFIVRADNLSRITGKFQKGVP